MSQSQSQSQSQEATSSAAAAATATSSSAATSAAKEEPAQRSHKCSSCNCAKQLFYERGPMISMKNKTETYIIEYSGFECASCGHLMPFKTSEIAYGTGGGGGSGEPAQQHRSTS